MDKAFQDLVDFHRACNEPAFSQPAIPPKERINLRHALLREEFRELQYAMNNDDLVEIADGLVDLIYVAIGTALEYGIDLPAVWREIHDSNMRKVDPETGKVRHREDGKVLKPDGWQPPDVAGALGLRR